MEQLEEIQCPMCKEQFNEKVRVPLLLPDCGHSYCIQCIEEHSNEIGFNLRRRATVCTPSQDDERDADAAEEAGLGGEDGLADNGDGGVDFDDDDEDLTKDFSSDKMQSAISGASPGSQKSPPSKPKFTFACPEDGVECNFSELGKLPKNFAMLKVLHKHVQAKIKTVQADFSAENQDFIVTETPQHSLTKFLSDVSATTPPAQQECEAASTAFTPQHPSTIADSNSEEQKVSSTTVTPEEEKVNNRASNRMSNFQDRFAKAKKEIEKKQEETKKKAYGVCNEHQACKELICLSGCQVRVCPHCALFGSHKGHDVRKENEVFSLITDHSNSINQMLEDMRSAQAELSEPKYYWQFANKYREKKETLKAHIQQEFRVWRKSLRALEMKILDDLHHSHYQHFEEKFQKAKTENQKMLTSVNRTIQDTQKILDDFKGKQALDKHWIDFKLASADTIDLILTQAEAQMDGILNWREFKELDGLDKQYEKINVIFDPAFEAVAEKLCTINGWEKKDGKIENKIIGTKVDLSGDMNAHCSFDSQGRSIEAIPPDISRISFEYEQTNTSGGAIKPGNPPKDVFLHTSMEETGSGSNYPGNLSSDVGARGAGPILSSNDSDQINTSMPSQQTVPNHAQNMFKRQSSNLIDKRQLQGGLPQASPRRSQQISQSQIQSLNLSDGAAQSLPPKPNALKTPSAAAGKKVSKESAIGRAFKTEMVEGCVNLSGRNIGDQQINEINKNIKSIGFVHELDLSNNKITDSGVQHLAKAICDCQVESLNLSNNKINEKCMEQLAAVLKFAKSLRTLNLEGNGITNRVSKNKLKNSLTWMQISL